MNMIQLARMTLLGCAVALTGCGSDDPNPGDGMGGGTGGGTGGTRVIPEPPGELPVTCSPGTGITYQIKTITVPEMGATSVGVDLDGTTAESCNSSVTALAEVEGPNGEDNALPGLVEFANTSIEGSDVDLNDQIREGLEARDLDLKLVVDRNANESCANVTLITTPKGMDPIETSTIMNFDGTEIEGILDTLTLSIPFEDDETMETNVVDVTINSVYLKTTVTDTELPDALVAGLVPVSNLFPLIDEIVGDGSVNEISVLDILETRANDPSANCNALSLGFEMSGALP